MKGYLLLGLQGALGVGGLCLSLAAAAIDLVDSLELAKEHDAAFLSARYEREATEESRIQARAALLPHLSYQYETRETDQDIIEAQNAIYDNTSSDFRTDSHGLTLTQTLFNYEKFFRYSQSKVTVNRAQAEFELALQDMYMRVAEAYFLVLERQDQLATVQAEKDAMEKHLALAESKVARGLSRSVDAAEARAKYLNALSKEIELQSFLMDARYALRESIGRLPEDVRPLKEDIALERPVPVNPQAWADLADAHNLALRAAELNVKEASKEVTALKGRHYPTLDLVYTEMATDAGGSLYDGSSEVETGELSLQLNIPLYSGGAIASRVRQAVSTKYRAEEELTRLKREVQRQTVDAMQRIGAAIAQIEALEQSVAAQQQALETKQRGYGAGRYHIIEVLEAQQDLSSVQQALTKARYDYALNTLRLKYSAGVLTEEDLRIVNGWLQGNERWSGPVYDPDQYRQINADDLVKPAKSRREDFAPAEGPEEEVPAPGAPPAGDTGPEEGGQASPSGGTSPDGEGDVSIDQNGNAPDDAATSEEVAE